MSGKLKIVGAGIDAQRHMTIAGREAIEASDMVLYATADPFSESFVKSLSPNAENLYRFYDSTQDRRSCYAKIVEYLVSSVHKGAVVCAVVYGHPTAGVDFTRIAGRSLKTEGYDVDVIPGISAEDCLYADLLFDPVTAGVQTYEASNFLSRKPKIDVHSAMVLWQVGVIGSLQWPPRFDEKALKELIEILVAEYGSSSPVTIYEASTFSMAKPRIEVTTVANLNKIELTPVTTLFVPPLSNTDE